jgi:hypothetical protein
VCSTYLCYTSTENHLSPYHDDADSGGGEDDADSDGGDDDDGGDDRLSHVLPNKNPSLIRNMSSEQSRSNSDERQTRRPN